MTEKSREEKRELLSQVESLRAQKSLTIVEACHTVGISSSSYYKWRRQAQVAPQKSGESAPVSVKLPEATKVSSEDGQKILEIKAQFPHMGVKQLRQYLLRNHQLVYSTRQIRQLLKSEQVPSLKAAYPEQPIRRFERDLPNEMWQIDIMNFHVGSQSFYLTSFLDDHSRFIVSYSVTEEQSSGVVLTLLRRAVSFRKPLSIITDRGIQFCSWNGVTSFQMELKSLRIDHLLAREQHWKASPAPDDGENRGISQND